MTGQLDVVGVGPAGPEWMTPETTEVLAGASDLIGYGPYLERVPGRGQRRHASDNRQELDRAAHALDLAAQGRRVAVVSGGDPGIYAMAAAVFEAVERMDRPEWREVDVRVHPGVSALQAVAARIGAPLGNDFCVVSLSDNLKPWRVIEARLRLAAEGDFAMALYNPVSRARPWQLARALEVIAGVASPATPVVVGKAVGRPGQEEVRVHRLDSVEVGDADMRTLVIVGASSSRVLERPGHPVRVYTPRSVASDGAGEACPSSHASASSRE